MKFERVDRINQVFAVAEVFQEEILDKVSGLGVKMGIHGYFSEEVFEFRIIDREGSHPIP